MQPFTLVTYNGHLLNSMMYSFKNNKLNIRSRPGFNMHQGDIVEVIDIDNKERTLYQVDKDLQLIEIV